MPVITQISIDPSTRDESYTVPLATTGPFNVPWPLFEGVGDDLQVLVNGIEVSRVGNWTFSATPPEPSFPGAVNTWTGGTITFTVAVQGVVRIVGRRSPRRESDRQFIEGRGTPARVLNSAINEIVAVQQEFRRDLDTFDPDALTAALASVNAAVAAANAIVNSTTLADGSDLNTLIARGTYVVNNPTNAPSSGYWQVEVYTNSFDVDSVFQRATLVQGGTTVLTYNRRKTFAGSWEAWVQIGGNGFSSLTDVNATGLVDGQVFRWNASTSKLVPFSIAAYSFDTLALAVAATVPAIVKAITLFGYTTLGDAPPAAYTRVGSEPTHPGKLQTTDGAWWELKLAAGGLIDPRWLGCKCDFVTDDWAAMQNVMLVSAAFSYAAVFIPAPGMVLGTSGAPVSSWKIRRTRLIGADFSTIISFPGNSAIVTWWDGLNGLSSGGISKLTLWAPSTRTTGQAIRLQGDQKTQPDETIFDDIRITGVGKWSQPIYCYGKDRIARQVSAIDVKAGGTGYLVGNTVTLTGGAFTIAATATVATVSSGAITSLVVTDPGVYSVLPLGTVALSGGSGSGATGALPVSGTSVLAPPSLLSGGTGYSNGNVLTLVGGTFTVAATLTVLSNTGGVITGYSVSAAGTYTVLPSGTVTVTGGGGTGATFALPPGLNSLIGLRRVTFRNVFIGSVDAAGLGMYMDTMDEPHIEAVGCYAAGTAGQCQITSTSADSGYTEQVHMHACNWQGGIALDRCRNSPMINGLFYSLSMTANSSKNVCSGVSSTAPTGTGLGAGNIVNQVA